MNFSEGKCVPNYPALPNYGLLYHAYGVLSAKYAFTVVND